MAMFIGSREAEQCRSHHQKMEKKYQSFPSILLYLRRFHYATEDLAAVQEDMVKNDVKEVGVLINHKELQDLELIKESPTVSSFQEEAKVQNEPIEAIK